MAQVLNQRPPPTAGQRRSSTRLDLSPIRLSPTTRHRSADQSWTSLQRELNYNGRFYCLFSDNRKQARKALDGALGGKKSEFEKWDKEIKKREESSGGGDAGGGGWFRWFGWSNDDNFWKEAQPTSLAILGILVLSLIIAKGELLLAVIFNPLLFVLRGSRNGFTFITSRISRNPAGRANFENIPAQAYTPVSAKESVVRKWGSD
ncbi:uncharacterized protein LOC132308928 isoform X2 [Cornus florida]|uniref:uncharacterized protein LOC132308928 isoform X2 n=1 Tax=Cornus florida TaxID=4283 RepID=UPI0028984E92|nr:uncharacterized protein LOC132308928 isoform X2 [Cornus florida]